MVTCLDAIARREPFRFGELSVRPDGEGWLVKGPATPGVSAALSGPDAAALRARTRFDHRDRYRPLSGALGLVGGWHVRCASDTELERVLEIVYPLALRHCRQWAAGGLRIVPLDDVLARQSGRYESAAGASIPARATATSVLCGRCVRVPVWCDPPGVPGIPCPEPCSVLVALCREAAAWERETPAPAPTDPWVPFAAFDTPGNEIREVWRARWQERPARASMGSPRG